MSDTDNTHMTEIEIKQQCNKLTDKIKHKAATLKTTRAIRLEAFNNKIDAIEAEMDDLLHGVEYPEKPYGIRNSAYLKCHFLDFTHGMFNIVFEFDTDGNPMPNDEDVDGVDRDTVREKGEALVAKWITFKNELAIIKAAKNAL